MTILHMNTDNNNDNDDDNLIFAKNTSTNQKKPIPQWARSNINFIENLLIILIFFF